MARCGAAPPAGNLEADMFPKVLAGAVVAASQAGTRCWYSADPPVPLRPLIELALRQLAAACSEVRR
jgi:hypothetical protein